MASAWFVYGPGPRLCVRWRVGVSSYCACGTYGNCADDAEWIDGEGEPRRTRGLYGVCIGG